MSVPVATMKMTRPAGADLTGCAITTGPAETTCASDVALRNYPAQPPEPPAQSPGSHPDAASDPGDLRPLRDPLDRQFGGQLRGAPPTRVYELPTG